MYKLFFATFFIAELIIALAIIIKLHKFDKCVVSLNDSVCANKNRIRSSFIDFRLMLEDINKAIIQFKGILRQKRHEYMYSFLKTIIVYCGIFLLKGKYKKAILAYQMATEIYEGFIEV